MHIEQYSLLCDLDSFVLFICALPGHVLFSAFSSAALFSSSREMTSYPIISQGERPLSMVSMHIKEPGCHVGESFGIRLTTILLLLSEVELLWNISLEMFPLYFTLQLVFKTSSWKMSWEQKSTVG